MKLTNDRVIDIKHIRIWKAHGQAALETAKICLINATATGTEILKNLILPGQSSTEIRREKRDPGELN